MTMSPPLTIYKTAALRGSLPVPAAKNSVLPLLAAALLCRSTVRLCRVPALADVQAARGILEGLGRPAHWEGSDLVLPPASLRCSALAGRWMGSMRSGIFFLAPVLAATGAVEFDEPGGCDLGSRPVDIHLEGLARMGAVCTRQGRRTVLRAEAGLQGCSFALRLPSVGTTETLLMAATAAKGYTRLENAALEPEVLDLVRFLNACGGCIRQLPGRRFVIRGTGPLKGGTHTPIADRIWAGTVLAAAAGCGGDVELTGIDPASLTGLPGLLRRAGCEVHTAPDAVRITGTGKLAGVGRVSTGPWPDFATDLAPILAAALLRAKGASAVCDTVFTHRFACASGFAALGAAAQVQGNCLALRPPAGPLHGAGLLAQDLRGGAALVLAALQAEGVSHLHDPGFIRRGYEDLPGALARLGAAIE